MAECITMTRGQLKDICEVFVYCKDCPFDHFSGCIKYLPGCGDQLMPPEYPDDILDDVVTLKLY